MTTLQLDISQRVNLIAILDGVEATGRREAWAVCKLQDQLQITDEEKEHIGWKSLPQPDGRVYATWRMDNGARDLKPFEFADEDMKRVCRAVDQFRMIPSRDRVWWEPLVAQLPEPQ